MNLLLGLGPILLVLAGSLLPSLRAFIRGRSTRTVTVMAPDTLSTPRVNLFGPPADAEKGSGRPIRVVVEGKQVSLLAVFLAVVVAFGLLVAIVYWRQIVSSTNRDEIILAVGLFLAMVAGMFVQVITANYADGIPLFQIPNRKYLLPLLYSPMVFYPTWVSQRAGPRAFAVYSAFLSGYFWQSIVKQVQDARARPPASDGSNKNGTSG